MTKTRIAIEITEESVRAIEVTTGRNPLIIAAGEVSLPPGAAKDSEILDSDAVVMAVKQLWARTGISGHHGVLAIASRRILVREHTSPALKPEMLRQALPFQVQDMLPVPISDAVLDFYPTIEYSGQIHGLLVAAVAETVEMLIAALAKARVRVDVVDLAPFGLARAAQQLAADECVAMVHLGDHTSYVVVVETVVPRFVRIIPATLPTAAVRARTEAVPTPADATLAKTPEPELALVGADGETKPRGWAHPGSSDAIADVGVLPTLRAAMRHGSADPAIADMVARVRDTIAFYDARPGTPRAVSAVYVSGGGADAPGMATALDAALKIPTQLISTSDLLGWRGEDVLTGDLARNLVPTLGMVLGEAMSWSRA